ncbi:bifunctional folylpolyglutamate synthase/dihydrofolate synthase [Clostridium tunisiense]|uniref:bifunctional folylpolyglutamate synthase/dihydrofolate synthase n=1 Tax=Clostridium tunisiense TaxID=219748 RepID=UPI00031D4A2E|nr:folylpolyglutamate synthase/dihydrofolate synthase family protein [Clostridium tunisiense]
MNYQEAINYIENTAQFGMKLGLERTEKILELLGDPHKKVKMIHIAGTNGKGSTTAMVSRVLMEAGYKVGTYISPYIEEFEERIQINNENIPKEDLVHIITEVSKAIDEVIALGYPNPTQFEIITCAAFLYYHMKKVDYAVIEVGLGGRLDSTNVITPILSIITSISLDHVAILGDTLDKIAFEKAGIIKEGIPTVLFPQQPEAEQVIEKVATERKSLLIKVDSEKSKFIDSYEIEVNGEKKVVQRVGIKTLSENYNLELALLGKHQILNATVAVYACEKLIDLGAKISKENIAKGMKTVKWPGRLEIMKTNPRVVIDGAHNIDGISKLTESIDMYFKYDNLILILGILADKQVREMIETIVPKASRVIAVTPNSERAELAEDLKVEIENLGVVCEAVEDYREAYEKALSYCTEKDLLLISGSLYMIGDMRKIIRLHKKS